MKFCRTLMFLLASCCIAGCAEQSRQTPPAVTATENPRVREPMQGAHPTPAASPDRSPVNIVVVPDSSLPKLGDYIYIEELPEAITRVPPSYPDEARKHGIQGTVMAQCLVLRDGTVGDVRIVNSVPGLDEAAAACLRQWRYKPAMAKGQPVVVWVAVPVKFSLH